LCLKKNGYKDDLCDYRLLRMNRKKYIQLMYSFKRIYFNMRMLFSSLTIKKVCNIFKAEYARIRRKNVCHHMPYIIIIDVTNICNLQCPLCYTGSGKSNRAKGTMTYELFQNIIDQVADYALHVCMYNWGEPLLVSNINDYIAYAKSKKISVTISTNLNKKINEEYAKTIIASGLDRLIISCDGCDQSTYEQYRRGGDYERVLENIKMLVDVKKKLKVRKPFIEWQYLLTSKNEHYVDDARQLATLNEVDCFTIGKIIIPYGWPKEEYRQWLPRNSQSVTYPNVSKKDLRNPCRWLWRSIVDNWDGSVVPCCYPDDISADFGNVQHESIKDVWNNDHYRHARTLFCDFNINDTVCAQCSVYTHAASRHKK